MMVLALDTSGAAVTVALHDGAAVLARRSTLDARRHAELLAPSIAAVLAEAGAGRADLTAVVVGVGPGPFTGLRVGIVTARVLGFALGVPVHGICSLDALAHQVDAAVADLEGRFVVATDARRRELYWAVYERTGGGLRRCEGPAVTGAAEIPVGLPVLGRGATLYPDVFPAPANPLDVDASALAELAAPRLAGPATGLVGGEDDQVRAGVLTTSEPLYLRRPDAVPPAARKRVLP